MVPWTIIQVQGVQRQSTGITSVICQYKQQSGQLLWPRENSRSIILCQKPLPCQENISFTWTFPSITWSQRWKGMRSRTPGDDGSSRLRLERSCYVGFHPRPLSSASADFAPGRLAAAASRAPRRFPSQRRLHTVTRRPCSPPLPCMAAVLSYQVPALRGAPPFKPPLLNTDSPCSSSRPRPAVNRC